MSSPRLTNCPECADVHKLIADIDCRIAELAGSMYNNISYMLNQPIPAGAISDLLNYRRILVYKFYNPNYAPGYTVNMIASRVNTLKFK